jgi:hypothetical protein
LFPSGFHASAKQLAPAIVEVRPVDRARHVAVSVPQQITRLLGVVAVHRGAVAKRVEGRQPQLAQPHLAWHEVPVLADD